MSVNDTSNNAGTVLVKYWPVMFSVASILIALGGIFSKLDYIADEIKKNEIRYNIISDKHSELSQSIIQMRGVQSQQAGDIVRNQQSINELRVTVDGMRIDKRWSK